MTSKPKLISTKYLTLHQLFLLPVLEKYFDWEIVADNNHSPVDYYYTDQWDDEIAINYASQGRKVILDCLWEPALQPHPQFDCYVLQNQNWMWYQESLWYRFLEYRNYVPNRSWTYHALMPMRRQKKFRDFVVKYLGNNLDQFLWSYQDQGRHLPNSGDPNDWATQRLFRPEWYDSCAMSLVLETSVNDQGFNFPLLSEKTFKPISFQHPFVICGDRYSLQHLHHLGFETFENLFDESYDSIEGWPLRLKTALNQCLEFQPQQNVYDSLTLQKLSHNHAHFFNETLVAQRMYNEIFQPLLEYAQT